MAFVDVVVAGLFIRSFFLRKDLAFDLNYSLAFENWQSLSFSGKKRKVAYTSHEQIYKNLN